MYGLNIYNIDLQKRTCVVQKYIDNHLGIEEFIAAIRAASEGLTDVTVEARAEMEYGDPVAEIVVAGTRPLTDAEYEKIVAENDRHQRRMAHMAQFDIEEQKR